jgi:membrane protein
MQVEPSDGRAQVGERVDAGPAADVSRALEPGCGRDAETPEDIPAQGWQNVPWRIRWSVSADRVLSTLGSVAVFGLLAVFPPGAVIVSLFRLVADPSTINGT